MAVTKSVEIDGKEVTFRASAAILVYTETSFTGISTGT